MMLSRFYLVSIMALSLFLSACQSISPLTVSDIEAETKARVAAQAGDYDSAAHQYEQLAQSTGGVHRSRYYIQAASAYWQLGNIAQARHNLAQIDRRNVDQDMAFDIAILEANIAVQELNPSHALDVLSPFQAAQLTGQQQRQFYRTRLLAYQALNNWLEQAHQHIALDALLPESQREDNQRQLWHALMQLSPDALDLFNPGLPPAIDSGWFSLAYLIQAYQDRPDVLTIALEDWQRSYPNHPAIPDIYQQDLNLSSVLPTELKHIAVLLPESGPYLAAGEAIKQGIFAAHYAENSTTQLHVIPVHTDHVSGISDVTIAYQDAVQLKADLVIGPLDKMAIDALSRESVLPIPILALNHGNSPDYKNNLYQFGLAPEQDAISAAQHAWSKGLRRAVVMAPDASWGQRIAEAFINEWTQLGGVIINQTRYQEADNDFGVVIKPLLGVTDSEARYQRLRRTLTSSLEFEPRRRMDIDIIFMVARPQKARQLVPQLKYHRSGRLPIVTTSHAYSGQENKQDIDLNRIFITDIPWAFPAIAAQDFAYQTLSKDSPQGLGRFLRLYALGADAYRLSTELNRLRQDSHLHYQGATGLLSIDGQGYIQRRLDWGQFNDSQIQWLYAPEGIDFEQNNWQ